MEGVVFGPGALVAIGLYLVSMIGVGWWGRRHRRDDSMADFYLAGRSLGFVVLLLTLYATQYSGNTMFGYAGRAYGIGFEWTVSILFMLSIIPGYLLFAPRLVALARRVGFLTPGDYLRHRFGSPVLTLLATVLMIYALGNYTLAQLKAMGAAVEGITHGAVDSAWGIVALAVIMVVYETLGGMRSVAWTDVLQGIVLLTGFSILLFVIPGLGGGLARVVDELGRTRPEMVRVPDREVCVTWVSYIVLIGVGAAVYPQAIQRLYAGRSVAALKRSLTVMAFLPLTTTFVALVCGVTGRVVLPSLDGAGPDQVLARLCALVMAESTLGYWLVVAVFAAALAALMSTADSALLSISSMFTRDVYQAHLRPASSQAELARVGKAVSWGVVAVLVVVAIGTQQTLVRLLELKLEVLVQIAPGFLLGLYWRRLRAEVVIAALLAGLATALGLTWTGQARWAGIHAGVVGLLVNLGVCAVGTLLWPADEDAHTGPPTGLQEGKG